MADAERTRDDIRDSLGAQDGLACIVIGQLVVVGHGRTSGMQRRALSVLPVFLGVATRSSFDQLRKVVVAGLAKVRFTPAKPHRV